MKGVNYSMKKALTLVLALVMVATFAVVTGAEDHECVNCDTDFQCIVAIGDTGLSIVGEIDDDANDANEGANVDRSSLARGLSDAAGDKDDLDTGVAGVLILGAVAVMAAGAVAITRKRA